MPLQNASARMAESVDALVSNTSRFTPVPVRPRLRVLKEKFERTSLFLFVYGMFVRGAGVRRFGGALAELSAGSSVATQLLSMPDSVFANKFSATISQCQQSAIDCTPCSAFGCYERSTLEKIGLDASVAVWQTCRRSIGFV